MASISSPRELDRFLTAFFFFFSGGGGAGEPPGDALGRLLVAFDRSSGSGAGSASGVGKSPDLDVEAACGGKGRALGRSLLLLAGASDVESRSSPVADGPIDSGKGRTVATFAAGSRRLATFSPSSERPRDGSAAASFALLLLRPVEVSAVGANDDAREGGPVECEGVDRAEPLPDRAAGLWTTEPRSS